jgi:hypothetical protein
MQQLSPNKTATTKVSPARRKFAHFAFAMLIAASATLSPTTQALAAKTLSKTVDKYEYKLEFNGTSTLLIADDGAICRIPRTGITYYCMAPSWKVIIFNDATKHGRIFPYKDWLNRVEGKTPIRIKSKSVIPSSFNGMPARSLYLEIEPMESLKNEGEFFYRSGTKKTKEYSRMEVLELQNKNISKQALNFIRWKFAMPFLSGPLLKSTNVYSDGNRETTVNTTSISRTTIPLSDWHIPRNFKEVDSTSKVNNERANYKNAAEMFNTLLP